MYRNFYSYNDMPQLFNGENKKNIPKEMTIKQEDKLQQKEFNEHKNKKNNILSDLKTDDIILIMVAFLLLTNDCDDSMLLIAIAFIFLSGIL